MAVENQGGRSTLICDECEDDLGERFKDFSAMIAHAKAEGWKIAPNGEGGWSHKCPDCQGPSSGLAAQRALFRR